MLCNMVLPKTGFCISPQKKMHFPTRDALIAHDAPREHCPAA